MYQNIIHSLSQNCRSHDVCVYNFTFINQSCFLPQVYLFQSYKHQRLVRVAVQVVSPMNVKYGVVLSLVYARLIMAITMYMLHVKSTPFRYLYSAVLYVIENSFITSSNKWICTHGFINHCSSYYLNLYTEFSSCIDHPTVVSIDWWNSWLFTSIEIILLYFFPNLLKL